MTRRRAEEYRKILAVLKNWERAGEEPSWTDEEWRGLMARAAAQATERPRPAASFTLRPLVSAAAVLFALAWGAILITKPQPPALTNLITASARRPAPAEHVPAFTWISPETGLTIVWFTNDNLKLEEFK
jgi:hypothetical protein